MYIFLFCTLVKRIIKLKLNLNIPCIPSSAWRVFPSQNIPSLFNYGHVHYYALESIQNVADHPEDIEDRLRHMTDKPLKNGRKYVDSGFVHDMMDTVNGDHYLMRERELTFDRQ